MNGFPHSAYPDALRLESPAPVHALPGFEEGWVTVQDASAQGCVSFLAHKTASKSRICAPHRGKQRIYSKPRLKRRCWLSMSTNSVFHAFTTTLNVWG